MPERQPLVIFPSADSTTIALIIGAVIGVFVLAVLIEVARRRRERRLRIEAEWRALRDAARDREMTDEEATALEAMVRRWMPESPFRAATVRHVFDECVDREMETPGDPEAYRRLGALLREVRVRLGLDYVPLGQRIHSTRELYEGQQVWVAASEAPDVNWHRMKVVRVDEGHFAIGPIDEAVPPPFHAGATLRFRLWREEDARYVFPARLDRIDGVPPRYAMHHTRDLTRRQSRAHYRARFDRSTDLVLLSAPRDGDYAAALLRAPIATVRARFVSLSGGGFALAVDQPLPPHVLLRVHIHLETAPAFDAAGRVVSTAPLAGGRHLVRAAFVDLPDEQRDAIAHYIFLMQQRAATAHAASMAE